MSHITDNLVPGETLLFETRHHWVVLIGPLLVSILLAVPGAAMLLGSTGHDPLGMTSFYATIGPQVSLVLGLILVVTALVIFGYGLAKRNATQMAVTNKRVLLKTGMASRRTLDLMLSKVESIGVDETVLGRMLGYGTVHLRGTGGTPESFTKISHPQEFRRHVQEQIGTQ